MVLGTFFLAAVPQNVAAHKPSSAGSALRLCSLVDEWGKSEKCSVSEWYRSVDITVAGERGEKTSWLNVDSRIYACPNLPVPAFQAR